MTHSSRTARERIIERLDPETGDADWDDIAAALRAVLEVCGDTTLRCRPYSGSEPYMVVSVDAIHAAIQGALTGVTP